jgi:Holliday junction resolvasome RuvABC endonuclease subunit
MAMKEPIILSVDPGSKACHYSIVRPGPPGRVVFVTCGEVASDPAEFAALIRRCVTDHEITHFAIEWVFGYSHGKERSAALIETNGEAGTLRGIAYAEGFTALRVPAVNWRRSLVANGTADDAVIKRAVTALVVGLPTRTNEHVRDALGLGVVAMRWVNPRVEGGWLVKGV